MSPALRPHGHPKRSSSLDSLAKSVCTRFGQLKLGGMKDLEEAIICHRHALALRPHGHLDLSSSLTNLANAVFTRFEQLGKMEDLEEAIICHGQALALRPHGHPDRSFCLIDLASAMILSGQLECLLNLDCQHRLSPIWSRLSGLLLKLKCNSIAFFL